MHAFTAHMRNVHMPAFQSLNCTCSRARARSQSHRQRINASAAQQINLPRLQELTLANNTLRAIPPELARLTTLEELYLNGACGPK